MPKRIFAPYPAVSAQYGDSILSREFYQTRSSEQGYPKRRFTSSEMSFAVGSGTGALSRSEHIERPLTSEISDGYRVSAYFPRRTDWEMVGFIRMAHSGKNFIL